MDTIVLLLHYCGIFYKYNYLFIYLLVYVIHQKSIRIIIYVRRNDIDELCNPTVIHNFKTVVRYHINFYTYYK